MMRFTRPGIIAAAVFALAGCAPDYSPNTYDSAAVQQANKVDQGIVIGYRQVAISDDGTVGTVAGGAAGGILGAQTDSPTVPTALAALGGTVVGGLVGNTFQHAVGDTTGWEYIVREPKGDLVSVVQKQPQPIAIGQRVLVIEGKQARIVPDYAAAALETPPAAEKPKAAASATPSATPSATAGSSTTATLSAATPVAPTGSPPTTAASSPAAQNDTAGQNQNSAAAPSSPTAAPPATAATSPPPPAAPADSSDNTVAKGPS